jgi:hypothetical protein
MTAGQPVRRLNPLALQAEIADLLIVQNRLLGDIRDRLSPPTVAEQPAREPVEVQEPAPKRPPPPQDEPPKPAPKRPQRRRSV